MFMHDRKQLMELIFGKQEFDYQMAFAQSGEDVTALDAKELEAAGFDVVWKYEVRIREYVDRMD